MLRGGLNLSRFLQNASKHLQQVKTYTTFQNVDKLLANHDEEQISLLQEPCLLVNQMDECVGVASKKTCHLIENINNGMLHRAFSVFLFNSNNQLLLQQRSDAKITFPLHFTNTCCSHPLGYELERDEHEAMGVKRAAQRKLFHELGIVPDQVPLSVFHYITRIQYQSENIPYDGMFGENEIDYVLVVKKDVDIAINKNEVNCAKYVNQKELKELLQTSEENSVLITPWFRLICDNFLFKWWDGLNNLKDFEDHDNIHKF